jgi:hypothetical protein
MRVNRASEALHGKEATPQAATFRSHLYLNDSAWIMIAFSLDMLLYLYKSRQSHCLFCKTKFTKLTKSLKACTMARKPACLHRQCVLKKDGAHVVS